MPSIRQNYASVGRIQVQVDLTNAGDYDAAQRGELAETAVRRLELGFLVDTGATYICLPPGPIRELGLRHESDVHVSTANGRRRCGIYSPVRFTVMGRSATADVIELGEEARPLLGVVPMELVDLVPNPRMERLEGNPEHGGEWVTEVL